MQRPPTLLAILAVTTLTSPGAEPDRPMPVTRAVALDREIRYRPDGGDFLITNGERRFNRALYGGSGPGRVEGGDLPVFSLYLPGKAGTLKVGVITKDGSGWVDAMETIETRYRPGELVHTISDPLLGDRKLSLVLLSREDRNGLLLETRIDGGGEPVELVFAYGAANGRRFSRGGDIGADPPEGFDLRPEECTGQEFAIDGAGFAMSVEGRRPFRMTGTFPEGFELGLADAGALASPAELAASTASERKVLVARGKTESGRSLHLTIAQTTEGSAEEPDKVGGLFEETRQSAANRRNRVSLTTPDPYLNTLGGAIAIAEDGVWEAPSYVHGAVAWPARLNGWRGAYAADPLGSPDRAREHIRFYADLQLTEPADGPVEPDPKMNLARQTKNPGTRLYSSGYIASSHDKARNHYDMNLVFIDMLFRHLLWTGDREFAEELWPVIVRHLEWEKRCFDSDGDGLYDAFACIWASDALQYSGGGVTHSSAYNHYHNRMAAKVAEWIGKDPAPYRDEAAKILDAMNRKLWLGESGHFAEYVGHDGGIHSSAALWTLYHAIDSEVPTPDQALSMTRWADSHFAHIPVPNPDDPENPFHVLPTSDWHPYVWSINNVAMAEITHTALAYWQAGRPDKAFHLWKGTVIDNCYFGASPGNFQQLSFLDAYRGELYRDFADTVGINARAMVEGLLGYVPDAISGEYLLRPGFPGDWDHAAFATGTLNYDFRRNEDGDRFTIRPSRALALRAEIPARLGTSAHVTVNGKDVESRIETVGSGSPTLRFTAPTADRHEIAIRWSGEIPDRPDADLAGRKDGRPDPDLGPIVRDWDFKIAADAALETVPMAGSFNDSVANIFAFGKYLEPRADSVTLQLPTQGIGDWPAFGEMHEISDKGLRESAGDNGRITSPHGIPFDTPGAPDAGNILFTSRWSNYPAEATVPLSGNAGRVFLLMAGSTNPMQSRIDNGEVVVHYADGGTERIALRNPDTWWPIEQNYFRDDHAFRIGTPVPPRLHLETGRFENAETRPGDSIHGGAATVLGIETDPSRELRALTIRTLTNDVVIGLMAATLERP